MSMEMNGISEQSYSGRMAGESPKVKGGNPPKSEVCTTNTDQVDAEIKKLQREKERLMAQYGKASGDEKQEEELKKKIAQVDMELRVKDNDAYRRQNAVISN